MNCQHLTHTQCFIFVLLSIMLFPTFSFCFIFINILSFHLGIIMYRRARIGMPATSVF